MALAIAMCCVVGGIWLARHDFRSTVCRPVTFATLAGFTFDQDHGNLSDIPLPLRQLDGQQISIDGSMIPLDQDLKMTSFSLVPGSFNWHGAPLIQETIVARIVNGRCMDFCPDTIRISGTLHVRVEHDQGYVISIYTMTVDHAERIGATQGASPR